MPRAKIEAAFLGWQTVRILAGVPDLQAAWLIKAVCAWILEDREPADEDIPDECIGSWIAIHDESVRIHEARKTDIDNGKKGGRPPKETKGNPTEPEGNPTEPEGNPTVTKSKSKIEIENITPASAGVSRAPATVDGLEPSCPLTDEEVTHFAPEGMTPDEIRDWRDYYESREWRIEPNAPRPMTRAAARASLRRWHTMQGVREAREAHIDAKMDERHAAALAQRNGPPPPDFAEAEKRQRQREAEYAARVEAAKAFMPK